MDESKRDRLIAEHSENDAPIIDIRTFFDGNDDEASIGCNLDEHPGIARFREVLEGLLSRSDVSGVYARIAELDTGGGWPFTDTVAVTGTISADDLREAVSELHPDDVGSADTYGFTDEDISSASTALAVWWD